MPSRPYTPRHSAAQLPSAQPGRLSLLTLALASSLAAMTSQPAAAQATYTLSTVFNGQYLWTSDNLSITSSGGVDNGNITALKADYANVGTLTNSGYIQGGAAVSNSYGSITRIDNDGTIVAAGGFASAIYVYGGTIDTIVNSGTISGATASNRQFGIGNISGNIGTIVNSGTISNVSYGISAAVNGVIGTIANSGTVIGSLYAIQLLSGASIGSISNTGLISGAIYNDGSAGLTFSGSTTATFGTLTGLGSAIGTIDSANGVTFRGTRQLLNDNISAGTVTNTGSVIQLNNHITISGDYVQDATATLRIGVSDTALSNGLLTDTGYGRLIVNGDAYVASGSTIQLSALNTYSFAAGQKFVVIQATGSGTRYNESTLNYVVSGYSATGSSVADGSGYDLLVTIIDPVTGSSSVVNAATNRNAHNVLQGLFGYSGSTQSLLDVFDPAAALSDAGSANRAGSQLSPAATGSAAVNGVNAAFGAVQSAAGNRIDSLRTAQGNGISGIATGESTLAPALWGRAFGGSARQTERDGIAGYHAGYGGLIIGGDAQVQADWRSGALLSVGHVSVGNDGDNSGSSASVSSYGLMAYAGYDGHPWYLNLTAGAARQHYSTTRAISYTGFSGIANGSFNGLLFSSSAQAGYPLTMGDVTLTPLAGIRYANLRQDGYTESGGNGAALSVNSNSLSSLRSELGIRLERSLATGYGTLTPSVELGWHHEFRDAALNTSAVFAADNSGSTAFSTSAASALRNTAQLSFGATLARSKNLTLAARYAIEAASGYIAQAGEVTLRWQY